MKDSTESPPYPEYVVFEKVRIDKMELCYIVFADILSFIVASAFYEDKVLVHTFSESLFNKFISNCNKSEEFFKTSINIRESIIDYMHNIDIEKTYEFLTKPHFARAIDINLDEHREIFLERLLSGKYDELNNLSRFDYYNYFIGYYNYYRFMPMYNDYSAFYLESTVDYRFFILLLSFLSLHEESLDKITDLFKRIVPSKIATRAFHKTDLKKTYVLLIYRYYEFKPESTFNAVVSKIYEMFRDAVDNHTEIPNIGTIPYDTGVPSKDAIKRYLTEDGIKANDFKEIHNGKRKYLVLQRG